MYAKPLATSIIASVTMNGGMPQSVITPPDAAPTSPHTTIAPRHAAVSPPAVALTPPATSRIKSAATTAESAMRLPTERSMPPVMITKVIPTATMAITAIWFAMLRRFSDLRKFGHL